MNIAVSHRMQPMQITRSGDLPTLSRRQVASLMAQPGPAIQHKAEVAHLMKQAQSMKAGPMAGGLPSFVLPEGGLEAKAKDAKPKTMKAIALRAAGYTALGLLHLACESSVHL